MRRELPYIPRPQAKEAAQLAKEAPKLKHWRNTQHAARHKSLFCFLTAHKATRRRFTTDCFEAHTQQHRSSVGARAHKAAPSFGCVWRSSSGRRGAPHSDGAPAAAVAALCGRRRRRNGSNGANQSCRVRCMACVHGKDGARARRKKDVHLSRRSAARPQLMMLSCAGARPGRPNKKHTLTHTTHTQQIFNSQGGRRYRRNADRRRVRHPQLRAVRVDDVAQRVQQMPARICPASRCLRVPFRLWHAASCRRRPNDRAWCSA